MVLLIHHVSFGSYVDIPDDGTVFMGKSEPLYHFLLRYYNVIEGDEFKVYDKNISRINFAALIEACIYLYLLEWILFKFYFFIRGKHRMK